MTLSRYFFHIFVLFLFNILYSTGFIQRDEDENVLSLFAADHANIFLKNLDNFMEGFGEKWIVMPDGENNPVYASLTNPETRFENSDSLPEKVTLYLYTNENPNGTVLDTTGFENFATESLLPTKIVIHGWNAEASSSVVQDIKDAYLKKGGVNVIGVNWPSKTNYIWAVGETKGVGKYLASIIDTMVERKMTDYSDVHIIGHSLGAHVAGITGFFTKGKIGRITGLDPALPGFQGIEVVGMRLQNEDATFVDVIHTCSGLLGMSVTAGHVDFYPNGGSPCQPGCEKSLIIPNIQACSHALSHQFYAESINAEEGFIAKKCKDWDHFKRQQCEDEIAKMGDPVSREARGVYYLTTNDSKPYAKGANGTLYNQN